MIAVDKKEVLRYLGYRGHAADAETDRLIDQCLADLNKEVTPRRVFRRFSIERVRPDSLLRIAGMEIRSRSLLRNLRGCEQAILMGATLGMGPDRLIARASVTQMSRAVVLQAAAAAMIEAWCDTVSREIADLAAREDLHCRPRFSPGYGDFPLEYQADFAQILHIQKEIGVSLTGSLLMLPSKSVTAVIGLSPNRDGCVLQGCESCGKAGTCAFSRIL